jgi:hypothetical protein
VHGISARCWYETGTESHRAQQREGHPFCSHFLFCSYGCWGTGLFYPLVG